MKTKEVIITPEEAYELLRANNMKPVDGFVFWDDEKRKIDGKLCGVQFSCDKYPWTFHNGVRFFRCCACVVQIADQESPVKESLTAEKLYAERDIENLPNYAKHLAAMTAEGLHDKSAIAAELAYRDQLAAQTTDQLRDALAVEIQAIGDPFVRHAVNDVVMLEISALKWSKLQAVLQKHGITAERAAKVKRGAK
jgi:hypothetical protein